MRIKDICQWLIKLYQEGGLTRVYRGIYDYYRHSIADIGYQDYRVDNDVRWSIIESYIDSDTQTLVDLGCAEGFFVSKATEPNLDVYAIEADQDRIEQIDNSGDDNIHLQNRYITPDNIDDLPAADIYLFLTIHHHWVWQHGWTEATEMFRVIADRADIIAYEPPGDRAIRDTKQDEFEAVPSTEFYKTVVHDILDESIDIVECETVDYIARDRADPFFVLDTSDYSHTLHSGSQ